MSLGLHAGLRLVWARMPWPALRVGPAALTEQKRHGLLWHGIRAVNDPNAQRGNAAGWRSPKGYGTPCARDRRSHGVPVVTFSKGSLYSGHGALGPPRAAMPLGTPEPPASLGGKGQFLLWFLPRAPQNGNCALRLKRVKLRAFNDTSPRNCPLTAERGRMAMPCFGTSSRDHRARAKTRSFEGHGPDQCA